MGTDLPAAKKCTDHFIQIRMIWSTWNTAIWITWETYRSSSRTRSGWACFVPCSRRGCHRWPSKIWTRKQRYNAWCNLESCSNNSLNLRGCNSTTWTQKWTTSRWILPEIGSTVSTVTMCRTRRSSMRMIRILWLSTPNNSRTPFPQSRPATSSTRWANSRIRSMMIQWDSKCRCSWLRHRLRRRIPSSKSIPSATRLIETRPRGKYARIGSHFIILRLNARTPSAPSSARPSRRIFRNLRWQSTGKTSQASQSTVCHLGTALSRQLRRCRTCRTSARWLKTRRLRSWRREWRLLARIPSSYHSWIASSPSTRCATAKTRATSTSWTMNMKSSCRTSMK